jgi:hypothetical protein
MRGGICFSSTAQADAAQHIHSAGTNARAVAINAVKREMNVIPRSHATRNLLFVDH